jgi:multicomponent Na+:H+ antiporter subunit D
MSAEALLLIAIGAPFARACAAAALARPPGLRDSVNVALALAQAWAALRLVGAAAAGEVAPVVLARPLPDVSFALALEPVGVVIAATIGVLSAAHAVHTAGFLRATQDPAPARMMAFTALASLTATGVALASNLFTLFIFHQALILSSMPLAAHAGDAAGRRAARLYLTILYASSLGLLLPAIVWTYAITGELTFQAGGVLSQASPAAANVLLALFTLGYATLALPPLHRWLAATAGSSFPAIGAAQGLALAPAGAAALLKTALYIFGPAMKTAAFAAHVLLALAALTMVLAAVQALGKQDIRERLCYSAIAQLAAVTAGVMIAAPASYYAAILQVIAHSVAALAMIMAFANVYAATARTAVVEMHGLGRLMPWTFAGVAVGAASLVGLPPLAGAWPKLWLMTASAEATQPSLIWAGGLAALSVIAAFAYLAPLAANALVGAAPPNPFHRPDRAALTLIVPVVALAAAALALIAIVNPLYQFLAPIWGAAS